MDAKTHEHPTRGRKLPPEPLTEAEVLRLIAACSRTAPTGIRNRALIAVMWRAGLRISEALALKPADVDHDACSVRVLHGKGNRARTAGIDPDALALVQRWLDTRKGRGINGRAPLFCTLDGRPLQTAYVRSLLKRKAAAAGIEKRVHPHGLRHTHATELAAEGTPINVISAQLGHASSATTARYLDHIGAHQVVEHMRQRTFNLDQGGEGSD